MEVHIRRVETDGLTMIDIRDFNLETQEYGRGYFFPEGLTTTIGSALSSLAVA
jgi:hypothetical protein